MAVEFITYEQTERTELGTVAEVTGTGGKIALIPTNFSNTDKRVVLILKKLDGTSAQVVCSSKVSQGLRSKEISLSMIQGFNICENITPDGEMINIVTMPSGGGLIEFAVNDKAVAYQAPTFDPAELVAF